VGVLIFSPSNFLKSLIKKAVHREKERTCAKKEKKKK